MGAIKHLGTGAEGREVGFRTWTHTKTIMESPKKLGTGRASAMLYDTICLTTTHTQSSLHPLKFAKVISQVQTNIIPGDSKITFPVQGIYFR